MTDTQRPPEDPPRGEPGGPEKPGTLVDQAVIRGIHFVRREGRCGGSWTFSNSRMTIKTLVSLQKAGMSLESIQDWYPQYSLEFVAAALELPGVVGSTRWLWDGGEDADEDERRPAEAIPGVSPDPSQCRPATNSAETPRPASALPHGACAHVDPLVLDGQTAWCARCGALFGMSAWRLPEDRRASDQTSGGGGRATGHVASLQDTPRRPVRPEEAGTTPRSSNASSLLDEIHRWRDAMGYFVGDMADTASPEDCRAEGMRRATGSASPWQRLRFAVARVLDPLAEWGKRTYTSADPAIEELFAAFMATPCAGDADYGGSPARRAKAEAAWAASPASSPKASVAHRYGEVVRDALREAEGGFSTADPIDLKLHTSEASPPERLRQAAKAVWDDAKGTNEPGVYAVKASLIRDLDWALRASSGQRSGEAPPVGRERDLRDGRAAGETRGSGGQEAREEGGGPEGPASGKEEPRGGAEAPPVQGLHDLTAPNAGDPQLAKMEDDPEDASCPTCRSYKACAAHSSGPATEIVRFDLDARTVTFRYATEGDVRTIIAADQFTGFARPEDR